MNNYLKVEEKNIQSKRNFFDKIKELLLKNGSVWFYWIAGDDRSILQNRTIYLCYKLIGNHLFGGDILQAKRECKLNIGIDILVADNYPPGFGELYNEIVEPHDYEKKLKIMDWLSVTSLMKTEQGYRYIRQIIDIYSGTGVDFSVITDSRNY